MWEFWHLSFLVDSVFVYFVYHYTACEQCRKYITNNHRKKNTKKKGDAVLTTDCIFFFFWQDDIIDDVGDFVAAAEILKERGAYKIYIMATHGLLSADAPRLIEESAIDEVRTDPPHPRENWLFMYLNETVTQAKGEVVKGLFFLFFFFYGLSFVHCKQSVKRDASS